MHIYLLLIVILLFFILIINIQEIKKSKNIFNYFYWVYFTIVLFFTGFRFGNGWDYQAYYETIVYGRITNIISNGEELSIFLIEISQKLEDFRIFFFVTSFLILGSIFIFAKKYSDNPFLSIFIFITFPLFFLNSMSVIRFFSAVAVILYATKYLLNNQNGRFLISVIIASMFHTSAIITIIFIFINKINFPRKRLILILLASPMLSIILNYIIINFFPKYSVYLSTATTAQGTKAIIFVILTALLLFIFKNQIENDKETILYSKLFLFGTIIYLLFLEQGTLGHRLSLYGTIFMIYLIPKLITIVNKNDRWIVTLCVFVLGVLMFIYTLYVGRETYLPYKNTFFLY